MYCPQCGIQTEQKTKFCKSCGLKLSDHARLLEEPREADRMTQDQMRRERKMLSGVILTMITAFDLFIFLIVFGSITLPHLEGKPFQADLIIFLTFLIVSLGLGTCGVTNLISSGFFKNIRERQLRAELALLEEKRRALEELNSPSAYAQGYGLIIGRSDATLEELNSPGAYASPEPPPMKAEPELTGVNEHTTRELR